MSDKRARWASASSGVRKAPACTKYINGSVVGLDDLGSLFCFNISPNGSVDGGFVAGGAAGFGVPTATEGPKEPGTTGADAFPFAFPDVLLDDEADVELALVFAGGIGLTGFSAGIAGAWFVVTFGVAADASEFVAGVTAVVDAAPGAVLGTTGGVGFAGFLPYKALLGSQSLFFLDSEAVDSVV